MGNTVSVMQMDSLKAGIVCFDKCGLSITLHLGSLAV